MTDARQSAARLVRLPPAAEAEVTIHYVGRHRGAHPCSTCDETGRVPWEPGAYGDGEPDQPCPDCDTRPDE